MKTSSNQATVTGFYKTKFQYLTIITIHEQQISYFCRNIFKFVL